MDIAKEKGGKVVREDHVYQALTELGLGNYCFIFSSNSYFWYLYLKFS